MITFESLKSYQDTPNRLILLCLREIVKKPVNLCGHVLPNELGDLIAVSFRDYAIVNHLSPEECSDFFKHFKHKYIPLTRINFSNLPITESFFMKFLEDYKDQLVEIDVSRCSNLNNINIIEFNKLLMHNTKNHKSLIFGDTFSSLIGAKKEEPNYRFFDEELKFKKLVVHNVNSGMSFEGDIVWDTNRKLNRILGVSLMRTLTHLDLSHCQIGDCCGFMHIEALEELILYNSKMKLDKIHHALFGLKKLRVLDISRLAPESDEFTYVREEREVLGRIVACLPRLTRLDISGTNLVYGKDRHISAFESRIDQPFEFLGLYHTGDDAAYRSCIPALTIASEANETQMLNACEAYINRPDQLSRTLSDLYNFYKTITQSETYEDVDRALDVVLRIIAKHLNEEKVMITTTAALWCLVNISVTAKKLNDDRVRRAITGRLLDVMHYHKSSRVILNNGALSLLLLQDIICESSRIAAIALTMCRDSDSRTQCFGTSLLNTLGCQVGGDQKVYIGKLKAIETMLEIIKDKITEGVCDVTLEQAWSTLWNITDETPANCERFLTSMGLVVFVDCMDRFDNKEVLRNIMGLLGNVAECPGLRTWFLSDEFIGRFIQLLSNENDGIECSYNACGILANLVSSKECKQIFDSGFPRSGILPQILDAMRNAIARWPINSRRSINYKSFEPILRLLNVDENISIVPEAQYWAVFALTNLTRINPAKYCPLLECEEANGIELLRHISESPSLYKDYVRKLAEVAVYQYDRFQKELTLGGLEQCDSIELDVVKNFRAESNLSDGISEVGEFAL